MLNTQVVHTCARDTLRELLPQRPASVVDVAIIGSGSGRYGWKTSLVCDLDLWVYLQDRSDAEALAWLRRVRDDFGVCLRALGAVAECRAIDGPYKPTVWRSSTPHALLHLLLDDPSSFPQRSELTRFSWRKYKPWLNETLLRDLAPSRPTRSILIGAPWGIASARQALRERWVAYPELNLDDASESLQAFDANTAQFLEFCLYAVLMNARNLARVDGRIEGDTLPNEDFTAWFANEYRDGAIATFQRWKTVVSRCGYQELYAQSVIGAASKWLDDFLERI